MKEVMYGNELKDDFKEGEGRWYAPKEGGYMIFQNVGFNSIVPQSDSKPHDIASINCHCRPNSEVSPEGHVLHIIHNSFEETEAMNRSLVQIGIL